MNTVKLITMLSVVFVLSLQMNSSFAEETVYGWEMMNVQERNQHMETIRNLKTDKEREQYRIEHHKRMQDRAKERGMKLPEMSPDQARDRMHDGSGMGSGMGSGTGMGSGSGMGKGR